MPENQFNRESMARWYAKRHLKTDPGIRTIYYLPAGARNAKFASSKSMV